MLRRALAFALVVLAPLVAGWLGALSPLTNWLIAERMALHPRAPTGSVLVVEIDAKSIAALGSWPWSRRVHGQLIDALLAAGAAEIALDIDFSAPSNPGDDAAFEAALQRAGGAVILAAFAQDLTGAADSPLVYNRPLDRFADDAWVATVNVRPDSDGVVRAFSTGLIVDGGIVPSVPAVLGGGLTAAGEALHLDFSIDIGAIDRVSVADVLNGDVDPQRIAGKKIIVGAQAAELRDFFQVPVAGVISGAMLQAVATETLLQGRVVRHTSLAFAVIVLLVIGLGTVAIGRIQWARLIGALIALALVVEVTAFVVQARSALAIDTAPAHAGLALLVLIVLVTEIDLVTLVQAMWRARASNAESLLAKIVSDNFDGLIVVDGRGRIRAASRVAAELLGHKSDLTGLLVQQVLPPALIEKIAAALKVPAADRAFRQRSEFRLHFGNRERIFDYIITISQLESQGLEATDKAGDGRIACLTFSDVTDQRAAAARIERLARFDQLTALPNRNQLIERLEEAFASPDGGLRASSVVCFDLDGFKKVNDTLGHHFGDLLLKTVAERTKALLPPGGLLARLGGDEFAAILPGRRSGEDAMAFAQAVIKVIGQPVRVDGHRMVVGASAGVALADSADKGPDDIMKRADVALYKAKQNGGQDFVVFERGMLAAIVERQRIELDLAEALPRNELEVWYQPQIDLRTNRCAGVEALLRWRHPQRGLVSPGEFIPVAEAVGLVNDLGRRALEIACAEVASWPGRTRLAVNVSSVQFARCDMGEVVAQALMGSGLPPAQLEIEITETLLMQPSATLRATLERIRSLGVGIALDDFGTGYSSLSYLQKFPITKIKLDRAFVAGLPDNAGSAAIVRAVAGLARDLKLRLNAEGVENAAQAAFLGSLGVDEVQGYLYGRPQPAEEVLGLIQSFGEPVRLSA